MLVLVLCCMMKILEFSKGKTLSHQKKRRMARRKDKTMNELGVRVVLSPDSDCNSNHHGSGSYLSTTSSQDIDFIQDNSDYQWFLDYGYRDAGGAVNHHHHHQSILSLPESYEANDLNYYDAFAKNMDANLAEADMESFKTEDIHALLTNLPPMCTDHLSQENNRHGESYASVSGSMMAKFDFDSSISPHSSSHGGEDSSTSIYKSELLFSPVKETPIPANFSVDSLDCDMMLTCQANKDNYTIAFEGSVIYSQDSDYPETDKSENSGTHWFENKKLNLLKNDASMSQSDSGSFTTWSKLKKRSSENHLRRHPSGNNNNCAEATICLREASKSQSMPNLHKDRIKTLKLGTRKPVKVFDIQHQIQSSVSDMATSIDASVTDPKQPPNFNLVKLFMKQKSISNEGMSTTLDQLSSTENWPANQSESSEPKEERYDLIAEEPEDSSHSESVEQLTDSVSETNNNNNSFLTEKLNRSIQTSVHLKPKVISTSFLKKLKEEGEKQVYVLYPNYVLPNLDFLEEFKSVNLVPQVAAKPQPPPRRRPFSCNDLETLKKKGFGHVKDWDSLNFLLPEEYKNLLTDGRKKPLNESSSSGYRGSSSDLQSPVVTNLNPLFVYRYDSVTSSEASGVSERKTRGDILPPRPPLPRSILRREHQQPSEEVKKPRRKLTSETEDEGVASSSSLEELFPNFTDLTQLEEFLKLSRFSDTSDSSEDLNLKSYVSRFLSLKINQENPRKFVSFARHHPPNNSPNVSAFHRVDPICEESESYTSPVHKPVVNFGEKRVLLRSVSEAVEELVGHFSDPGATCGTISKLALGGLCPALYALLSEGLKPSLETSFGAINNSVWQVVEASAQQGHLTKALNELVMRINSEDAITEGLVKFNAFVFGLLNVRSLDAWMSYLRTRESILKKHYEKESLLVMSQTGGASIRGLIDTLIEALQPLALLPFQLDLLFEYRQLHLSFKRMEQYSPEKSPRRERPRSCLEPTTKPNFKLGDVTSAAKKRWSGVPPNSKLYLAFDRLGDEEEYTDSLETGAVSPPPQSLESNFDTKPINGRRFKKLQQRWEMLSGRESPPGAAAVSPTKSRIPRPVTSPVKPSGIPVLISPSGRKMGVGGGGKLKGAVRASRVDQVEETQRHIRPSSLPYKAVTTQGKGPKVTPPRRAASSSLNRKPPLKTPIPKVVRTLSHRVPSESGHLSYNEGEKLKVVLEVDNKWLLCCRGTQKGLVPKSAVIAESGRF